MKTKQVDNHPDNQDFRTGEGKHNRLVASRSLKGQPFEVQVREDIQGLALSTDKQRIKFIHDYCCSDEVLLTSSKEVDGSIYHVYN
jgi:hypothetical protein